MTTRSRAKIFRLFDLPQELQDHIYALAMQSPQPHDLSKVKLPVLLATSRHIRALATPTFFATGSFICSIRSSWCAIFRHWHTTNHLRYDQTGDFNLSAILPGGDPHATVQQLPEESVRLHHLTLRIGCCCCTPMNLLGKVQIHVEGRKRTCTLEHQKYTDVPTQVSVALMFGSIERMVEKIGHREMFNGLTIQDVKDLARCLRHDVQEGT